MGTVLIEYICDHVTYLVFLHKGTHFFFFLFLYCVCVRACTHLEAKVTSGD